MAGIALFLICGLKAEAQTVAQPSPASAGDTYPAAPAKYFNDYAGVTTATTQSTLNAELVDFDAKTANQVVVAIYKRKNSTAPLDEFCARTFNKWEIGRKGKDTGVVLFVFMDDHLIRISAGWGMSTLLPDAECSRIENEVITPELRKHDYDQALTAGVEAILTAIRENAPVAAPQDLR